MVELFDVSHIDYRAASQPDAFFFLYWEKK
jgi:hypothetical protein